MKEKNNQQFSKKNFFYSADSEHYQDAILTYIFYNYPEPGKKENELSELERFSKHFTRLLIGDSAKDITNIDVETQVFNSDIDLIIHTADGKDHLVIIEDKTGSAIHRSVKKAKNKDSQTTYYDTQLEKYYEMFLHESKYQDYFKEGRLHLFYYKNNYVDPEEKRKLERANEGCKNILCIPFSDEINKKKSELKKYENLKDGKKHTTAIANRKQSIQEYEKLTKEFVAAYNKYGNSIIEWKILDINWIFDAFYSFFKDVESANFILNNYFESIKFWKTEIDIILSKKYKIERSLGDDLKWGDRSKLWNPVFCQLIESALKKIKDESYITKVQTYNGRYWEMSIHSKDKKTCMIASAKGIMNDSFTIDINLRNKKYDGEDNVPAEWNSNDSKREKDRNKIINVIKTEIIDNTEPKISTRKKIGDQDSNKICSYVFKFKAGEKPNYDTLFKYWMKVLIVFANKVDGIK